MKRKLTNLSINMLIVLDALCRHKNTSKVADELGVSQSAVSKYIQRLRELTGEELFVRTRRGLEPSAACLDMREAAAQILDLAEEITNTGDRVFYPEKEARSFSISIPMQKTNFLFEKLTMTALARYPLIEMNLFHLSQDEAVASLMTKQTDLCIGLLPEGLPKTYEMELLSELDFRVMCSKKSSFYKVGKITKQQFVSSPHIKISNSLGETVLDKKLQDMGLYQEKLISVPDESAAAKILEATDYLFLLDQRDTARMCERSDAIKVLDADFDLPKTQIHIIWNRRMTSDPAHKWLRSFVTKSIGSG